MRFCCSSCHLCFFQFSESPLIVVSVVCCLRWNTTSYIVNSENCWFCVSWCCVFFFLIAHLSCQVIPQEITAYSFQTPLPALLCSTDLRQISHTLPVVQHHWWDILETLVYCATDENMAVKSWPFLNSCSVAFRKCFLRGFAGESWLNIIFYLQHEAK